MNDTYFSSRYGIWTSAELRLVSVGEVVVVWSCNLSITDVVDGNVHSTLHGGIVCIKISRTLLNTSIVVRIQIFVS